MEVLVGREIYTVTVWEPGSPVLRTSGLRPAIGVDTETKLIIPGEPVELALLQAACSVSRQIHLVRAWDVDFYLPEMVRLNPTAELIFHNASFDLHVLGISGPHKQLWVNAITENRIVDTGMRWMLRQLNRGSKDRRWKLDFVAKRLLHIDVPKDEEIRLTFTRDMELTDRHAKYAAVDAAITVLMFREMPEAYPTEQIQLLGAIALDSISRNGMRVDRPYFDQMKVKFEDKKRVTEAVMADFGYYAGVAGNSSVLQKLLAYIEKELQFIEGSEDIQFSRTEKTGAIQITDDSLSVMGHRSHPFLEAYQSFQHDQKILSTYINPELICGDGRVHPRFNPLMRTGRTSCSGPNLQNVPREEGVRGMYIPTEGYLLYAADYSQLELCALAQSCLQWYGASTMADVINAGEDLHRWFAGVILNKDQSLVDKGERQTAKACNFGFPGGLGLATFSTLAKSSYGVTLPIEECRILKDKWLAAFPEMKQHLSPPVDYSSSDTDDDGDTLYIGRTVTGRIRRACPYCSAANYSFQGLSADGAKIALWYLFLEGFRVVNFIHDEVIVELLPDEHLQHNIKRINTLMVEGMRRVIPDVKISVEGALMDRWYKDAEPVLGENGDVLLWQPTANI